MKELPMVKIAINGLGRIGRAVLKIAMDTPDIKVLAVNDLLPVDNLTYLLKYDTVYGRYQKSVTSEGNSLKIADKTILMYNSKDPSELPWKNLDIDVTLECTGHFTSKEGLEKHLKAGAKYAILSAPSKDDGMRFVVPGVNHAEQSEKLFSTTSCTTNCITPVVEIINRRLGVQKAIMSTVHAYTSSQAIVDGPSKKFRRGRAAAANLVPTSTGAAKATTKVIPQLEGKFDGVAIRAPIPVGSISDIVFVTSQKTTVDYVNKIFREESETERYKGILGVSDEEIVSSDIIGDSRASIVDLTVTKVVDGDLLKIMSWYDNEWGYASQMIRETSRIGKFFS
jgi:glyceraldehyde 3-phosphate dehydrogenase